MDDALKNWLSNVIFKIARMAYCCEPVTTCFFYIDVSPNISFFIPKSKFLKYLLWKINFYSFNCEVFILKKMFYWLYSFEEYSRLLHLVRKLIILRTTLFFIRQNHSSLPIVELIRWRSIIRPKRQFTLNYLHLSKIILDYI